MPAEPKAIIPLLAYQRADIENRARFCWCNWSRQIGKSFTKSLKRLLRGIARRRNQILLSASESQSRELMEKVAMHCQALNMAHQVLQDERFEDTEYTKLQIQLPNHVRVIGLPANPRTARGFTGDVFLDEFAMHREDKEIWGALFPTVMRGNGELDVASTPKGLNNTFARLKDNPEFSKSTVTIFDAVADGLDVDPEQLRRGIGDEDLWRQEFLCEFIDEATAFLTYEAIAACEDVRLPAPIVIDGTQGPRAFAALEAVTAALDTLGHCYLGVDVARSRDLTVWWLVELLGRELVTRAVVEVAKAKLHVQAEHLFGIIGHKNVQRCAIDMTGIGMQMAEEAQEKFGEWKVDAINFASSVDVAGGRQPVKTKLAGGLRVRVEDRLIRIPSSQAIRNDWHSIEKIVTTGGSVVYRAERGPGGHADRFWAAALAVDAAGPDEPGWNGAGLASVHRTMDAYRRAEEEAAGMRGLLRC